MCMQELLCIAARMGLHPATVKYSRASFLFPDQQPPLYQDFDREAAYLRDALGALGRLSTCSVLGSPEHGGMQWHVFEANERAASAASMTSLSAGSSIDDGASYGGLDESCSAESAAFSDGTTSAASSAAFPQPSLTSSQPLCTLEMCMTGLSAKAAARFVRGAEFVSSAHTTLETGIRALVPEALIDDYVFEPCGCAPAPFAATPPCHMFLPCMLTV